MWGHTWGAFRWGVSSVPALGFWGAMLLGCLVGVCGVLVLRSSRRTGIATLLLALLVPLTAIAGVPFIFTNGQIADANQVNADFAALTPIQGSSTTSGEVTGQQFLFPPSPAFTAPRNLSCIVTVQCNGVAGGTGLLFPFNSAIQVGSTQTAGSASNFFFVPGPVNGPDANYTATYTQVFSVNSGSSVSFGALISTTSGNPFEVLALTAIYNCI